MSGAKRLADDLARGIGSAETRALLRFPPVVNALSQRYPYLFGGMWKCSVCHLALKKDLVDPLFLTHNCSRLPSLSVPEMADCGMIRDDGHCIACGFNTGVKTGKEWHQCGSSLFTRNVVDVSALISTDNGALPLREYNRTQMNVRDKCQGHVVVIMEVPYCMSQLKEVEKLPQQVLDSQPWHPEAPEPFKLSSPKFPKGMTQARYDKLYDIYEADYERLKAEFEVEQAEYTVRFNADDPRRLMRFHVLVNTGCSLHPDGLGVSSVLPTGPPVSGFWRARTPKDAGYVKGCPDRIFEPCHEIANCDSARGVHPELQTFVPCTYSGVRVKTVDVPDDDGLASMREGEEEDAEYSICPKPSGIGFLLNGAHGQFTKCNPVLLEPYKKTFLYVNKPIVSGTELSWNYKAKAGSDADKKIACNCGCGGKLYPE